MHNVTCERKDAGYLLTVILPKFAQAHWEEVGQDKSWEPDPNVEAYHQLESDGNLYVLALMVDGEPEGYFIGILAPSLHYRSKLLMVSDMFYVSQEFRAKYAIRLFRAAEAMAADAGADKMFITYKLYKNVEPIMRRLRFTPLEQVAAKKLR